MKLYFMKDACSLSIRILINEMGLSCEYERVDYKTKMTDKGVEFKSINPKLSVPVLILDSGETLTENVAIQIYLSEHYPAATLIPAPPTFQRYQTLEWLSYITTDLHKSFVPFFAHNVPEEAKTGIFATILRNKFKLVNEHLATHKFLMGDDFTGPDAYLFVVSRWLGVTPCSIDQWPHLQRFMKDMQARPAVIRSLAEEDEKK